VHQIQKPLHYKGFVRGAEGTRTPDPPTLPVWRAMFAFVRRQPESIKYGRSVGLRTAAIEAERSGLAARDSTVRTTEATDACLVVTSAVILLAGSGLRIGEPLGARADPRREGALYPPHRGSIWRPGQAFPRGELDLPPIIVMPYDDGCGRAVPRRSFEVILVKLHDRVATPDWTPTQ